MASPKAPESAHGIGAHELGAHEFGAPEPGTRPFPLAGERAGRSHAAERWLARKLLALSGARGLSLVLWDGEELRASSEAPRARLRVADRRTLLELALVPDPNACDAYVEGRLEVEGDLLWVLEGAFGKRRSAPPWVSPLRRSFRGIFHRRSVDDVQHHYDIGNDFYRLWLDDQLVYTCAYFPDPSLGLEQAQAAKLDHVCRKLDLRPGERVVEAGCGWGALALHMARNFGVQVTAFNVSEEQIAYAREAARRAGLEDRVEFVQDHYEAIRGRYDAFVSVGMLEHVGRRCYAGLSRVIDRCLGPQGRGLIHAIGRARPENMSPWLERRIFPGAYIPSLREMLAVLEPASLAVTDVENLRQHYERTLELWLERFEAVADRVEDTFDARFVRTWRLYLAGSIASFRNGSTQLFQIAFARNEAPLPWTRAGLYEAERQAPERA